MKGGIRRWTYVSWQTCPTGFKNWSTTTPSSLIIPFIDITVKGAGILEIYRIFI